MTPEKPSCSDFIIATIRHLRPQSTKGRMIGVRFRRITDIVLELYSEEDYRSDLKSLLGTESVVIFSNSYWTSEYEDGHQIGSGVFRGVIDDISVLPIPSNDRHRWWIDKNSNIVEKPTNGRFSVMANVQMYVAADGLPKKLLSFVEVRPSVAETILESMQRNAD